MQLSFTKSRAERLRHRLGQIIATTSADEPGPSDWIDEAQYCAVVAKPKVDRVREAFETMPPTAAERLTISTLVTRPWTTSVELSTACGWGGSAWRVHLILLCQRRRHVLWPGGLGPDATNGLFVSALVDYNPDTLAFRIKPEFEEYFRDLLSAPAPNLHHHAAE